MVVLVVEEMPRRRNDPGIVGDRCSVAAASSAGSFAERRGITTSRTVVAALFVVGVLGDVHDDLKCQ